LRWFGKQTDLFVHRHGAHLYLRVLKKSLIGLILGYVVIVLKLSFNFRFSTPAYRCWSPPTLIGTLRPESF